MTRTTLAIDPEVLAAAKELAEAQGISLGGAVSFLIRQGLNATPRFKRGKSGFLMFDVHDGQRQLTSDDVARVLEAEDLEYAKYFRRPE